MNPVTWDDLSEIRLQDPESGREWTYAPNAQASLADIVADAGRHDLAGELIDGTPFTVFHTDESQVGYDCMPEASGSTVALCAVHDRGGRGSLIGWEYHPIARRSSWPLHPERSQRVPTDATTEQRTPESEEQRVQRVHWMLAEVNRLTMEITDYIFGSTTDPPNQTGDDFLRAMLERARRAHAAVFAERTETAVSEERE